MKQILWRCYRLLASGALVWITLWMMGFIQMLSHSGTLQEKTEYNLPVTSASLGLLRRSLPIVPTHNTTIKETLLINTSFSTPMKVILRWTSFYGKSWGVQTGSTIFHNLGCPHRRCVITDDKEMSVKADAILVHLRDISHPKDLPKWRHPRQRYVAYVLESPLNVYVNLTLFNNVFNWTSSYREDSDLPSPYGSLLSLTNNSQTIDGNDVQHYNQEHLAWKRKTRLAAIFMSNCRSTSHREDYVNDLRRYVTVDVYGACEEHKCLDAPQCLDMLQTHYKFYLAFENSACLEYVTEKFWFNALKHGTVPVVLGAPRQHYEKLAPPHSFIHVSDFQTPAHLARFLKRLDKDFNQYYKYRKWSLNWEARAEIILKPLYSQMWCHLCSALHTRDQEVKVIQHLDQWWSVENQCPRNKNILTLTNKGKKQN